MAKRYTRRTEAEWQEHIHHQQQSGLSITAYCQQHKLATSNFYHWRNKLNQYTESNSATSVSSDWLALPTAVTPSPSLSKGALTTITLSLPGNITLSIASS